MPNKRVEPTGSGRQMLVFDWIGGGLRRPDDTGQFVGQVFWVHLPEKGFMSIASPGSRSLSGAPPHSNAEPYVGLARWHETGNVSGMSTVAEFQSALAKLPVEAQCEIAAWLESRLWPETPAMLAAIDEAEISLVEDGGVPVEDVRKNLRQWITG